MATKKIFLILGTLVMLIFLATHFSWQNPKEVKGASTAAPEPTPIVPTPGPEQTPQGKFYAPILAYHHIAKKWPQNSYYVSPEIFEEQIKWLIDNDYQIISFDKFYQAASGDGTLPEKPVVITFDDGVTDQYINAFPILQKYNITATFFIKLNNVGRGKGGMTWEQMKELIQAGNIIGSHSINHNNMIYMSGNKLEYEIQESKRLLEENLKIKINYFCYPGGSFSKQTIEALKDAGYLAAVTTKHKVNQEIKNDESLYTLPRVHIDDEMPTFTQWVQGINLL